MLLLLRDPPPGSEVGCSTQKKPRDSLSNCKSSCQSVQEQYKPTNSPQISRVNSAQRVAWFHSYCLSVCCCSARRCVSCTAHQPTKECFVCIYRVSYYHHLCIGNPTSSEVVYKQSQSVNGFFRYRIENARRVPTSSSITSITDALFKKNPPRWMDE